MKFTTRASPGARVPQDARKNMTDFERFKARPVRVAANEAAISWDPETQRCDLPIVVGH